MHCRFMCRELGARMAYRGRQSKKRHAYDMEQGRAAQDKVKKKKQDRKAQVRIRTDTGYGKTKQTVQGNSTGT